eukprot:scaffold408_cov388-Prasinococcus_capsulatus_cf.AAC.6
MRTGTLWWRHQPKSDGKATRGAARARDAMTTTMAVGSGGAAAASRKDRDPRTCDTWTKHTTEPSSSRCGMCV